MSEKTIEGITKIAVKGFKSIAEECEIDIRPLTILAGANSSGKSSFMQPLLMLKQTLEAPYDPGPLLIDGPNVQFTEAEQFLSKSTAEKRTDRFQIQIKTRDSDFAYSVETTLKKGRIGFEIVEMTVEAKQGTELLPFKRFTLYPEMSVEEIKALGDQGPTRSDFKGIKRSRCFLCFESQESDRLFNVTYNFVESYIFDSIHLPGLRGNPERIYKLTSTGPRYPGTFENYAATLIHEWQETKDERLKVLTNALYILGLTRKVSTKRIGDIGVEVQVGRLPRGSTDEMDMVNITDVGLGVSQVLPVIVALIVSETGQLVYLEQPELHLHPRAQVALAQVLADAAKRGVRVVAETHSSLLLLGVQTLVAEGDLSPELVKLHWFSRQEDGVTEVNSADLDEAGAYGEWPEDFADVSLNAQSRFLDAVDNVRFGDKETS
ncbi:MAG: AAA family ATPase [Candidatus Poribacteria bacterium]|nr:AAA family ATPase [Candidatus Poribacteria bacterium]